MAVLPHVFLKRNKTFRQHFFCMTEKEKTRLKKIGANILRIREKKGLSQEQLAANCDVDRGKISKIENATANYYITTLIEIAKGLDVDPKKLIDLDFDFEAEQD